LVKGGVTYRILSDQVGSVRLVVNATTGAVVQRIDYDAFRNVLADTNPGFQPFGFAGGLTDADTGFVRFGARDYAPRVGRWTSKDLIDFLSEQMNLFAYVASNPVNDLDPLGTISLQDLANFSSGFGSALTFGLTGLGERALASFLFGDDSSVTDPCSAAFRLGTFAGYAHAAIGGLAGGARLATRTVIQTRARPGFDGGISQMLKLQSRFSGRTLRVQHRVLQNGKATHQHTKFQRFLPF